MSCTPLRTALRSKSAASPLRGDEGPEVLT